MVDASLHFEINSSFAEARQVQDRVMDEIGRRHYCTDAIWALRLAVEEALINAIKHGNKFSQAKKVHIDAFVNDDRAEIVIEDEGEGFDRAAVPDPTADQNLERLHGRGILLMEAYMDEVQWTRGGRRVRIVRRNAGNGSNRACS